MTHRLVRGRRCDHDDGMRIFVTGASGFVGSAVVAELLRAGHQVVGLARSDASAAAVKAAGAEVQRGDLTDLDGLGRGASSADGVIHLGFIHDFANYAKSAETDRAAIQTMAAALAGSNRPLVVTSGTLAAGAPGAIGTEGDPGDATRRFSESALEAAPRGVRGVIARLSPTVHGDGDHGFVPRLIQIARDKGISGYPGDGTNRWSAVHRLDAATLFRLGVENAPAGARLHAAAEEAIPSRQIAEAIGKKLGVPVQSIPPPRVMEHFGWLGAFFSMDKPASSAKTRELLGWKPTQIGLIQDLEQGTYFAR
jgi:nucleoside-diphosphate-sugar epimerase